MINKKESKLRAVSQEPKKVLMEGGISEFAAVLSGLLEEFDGKIDPKTRTVLVKRHCKNGKRKRALLKLAKRIDREIEEN